MEQKKVDERYELWIEFENIEYTTINFNSKPSQKELETIINHFKEQDTIISVDLLKITMYNLMKGKK